MRKRARYEVWHGKGRTTKSKMPQIQLHDATVILFNKALKFTNINSSVLYMLSNKAQRGIKPTSIMRLAFNTITTAKLDLFVLSAFHKRHFLWQDGFFFSFSNSGKWHVKEIASHPTTHLHRTFFFFLNQTFRDVSNSARQANESLDYLGVTIFPGVAGRAGGRGGTLSPFGNRWAASGEICPDLHLR